MSRQTKQQCGAWNGNQCRATKDLTWCAMTVQQGTILKGPDKVVVPLCPKHFQLDIQKRGGHVDH
jgi:hypothetical protein